MVTIYSTSNASESEAGVSVGLTFVSNDKANHRLAIISLPELKDDADRTGHVKLQHVAFEYPTIDDHVFEYTADHLSEILSNFSALPCAIFSLSAGLIGAFSRNVLACSSIT